MLALYAELDDRAAELVRASQLKSAFLSGISHELRTPLNSILNITRILLERMDGELSPEQDRQVSMIRRAAASLIELVNDLLDLARIEAGKTEVRVTRFTVGDLFGTLRGMFRPMVTSDEVTLQFEADGAEIELSDRRGQGRADPPELHLQRDQVHRAGRDPGHRRAGRRRGDGRARGE